MCAQQLRIELGCNTYVCMWCEILSSHLSTHKQSVCRVSTQPTYNQLPAVFDAQWAAAAVKEAQHMDMHSY